MRLVRFACVGALVALACAVPSVASAQAPDAQALQQQIDQLRQQFQAIQDRLNALQSQLSTLQPGQQPAAAATAPGPAAPAPPAAAAPAEAGAPAQTAEVPPGAEGAGGPSGSLPLYGAGAAASKAFNPDMAVIGDFLGAAGHNAVNPSPAMEMHESEASFQAVVDPYARADFFISFGEEGVNLEEGFMTFPAIPGGLLVKVGKQRAAFGKVNTLHNHVLPWTDRPLVINSLVGGEDGINDAGISVARLIPNPWMFLEATGQVYRGDSDGLYKSSKPGDLSYVGHLRGYQDITESTNVDLGASWSRGHNDAGIADGVDLGRFTTQLFGVDATLRWKPLQRAIYHSFVGRSELVWSRREEAPATQRAFGYYVSGDYQFARRWFAGARYDLSDRATNASLRDHGQSAILTYWPSEFSQVRGQYRRTKYADSADTANEFLFQFQFSIGAHGAHPF